ncbi:MAG: type II toxin-antitoxin system VapB family antitoxin [Planktothrix sp.]
MKIPIEIDQQLIAEALALSNFSTENQLIEDALREYIQRRQQQKIFELFGTIDYEENYDYKQQRKIE